MIDKIKQQDEIRKIIQKLFSEKLSENGGYEDIWQYADEPLTGEPFFFSETGMVYLLFEIEKQFGIRVTEDELLDYGFSTINRIVEIVQRHLTEEERRLYI